MLLGVILRLLKVAAVDIVAVMPTANVSTLINVLVYIVMPNELVGLKLTGLVKPTIVRGLFLS